MNADRNRRIVACAIFGKTMEALGKEHDLSTARVGSLVRACLGELGMSLPEARNSPQEALRRLRNRKPVPHLGGKLAETPEEFFSELLHEPRRIA